MGKDGSLAAAIDSPAHMHEQGSNQSATQSLAQPAEPILQNQIEFPQGFDPACIDKTVAHRQAWVHKLTHQKLGKFKCMDPVKYWTPLPTDPLLDI
eukprot:SAG11_NODE_18225_length_496_cov_4.727960_1_plen_95_part_10